MASAASASSISDHNAGPDSVDDEKNVQHNGVVAHEESYSVWSFSEKLCIVALTGSAGMLSTMNANVYFPAIPLIAEDLNVSIAKINLTITSYLVLQAPMVFGPLADYKGRRLAYAICLAIAAGANLGLALLPKNAYWLLVLLRCLQSAGSASTISIGFGTITDIATPGDRGLLGSIMTLGPMAGPCIGPIIGGALADKFGWRGIFWFMAALCAAVCVAILLFLPETLRAIVHTGEIRPVWYLRPILPFLTHYDPNANPASLDLAPPKRQAPRFLKQADCLILLTSNACGFGLFQALMASLSPVFEKTYPFLTQTTVGLCFLSVGGGALCGSLVTGRVTDAEFRRVGGTRGAKVPDDFPLEVARLRLLPIYVLGSAISAIAAGWALDRRASIAVPLVFYYIFGWSATGTMNAYQVLLMDLAPGQGASVTAANNMFRCLLSAGLVAAIDPLRMAIGVGWMFVLLAGVMMVIVLPLFMVEMIYGPRWRAARHARQREMSSAV